MMPRPRVRRFLHRLGDMLCFVFVDPGPVLEQAEVDKGLQAWCERNP
jgi:hypothetical protein